MKKPISATIEDSLIKWMDSELKDTLTYRNKSHLIEVALISLKEKAEIKKR
jgi:Arc/MetJ-type ribon-helix-helix transcriptional regulator